MKRRAIASSASGCSRPSSTGRSRGCTLRSPRRAPLDGRAPRPAPPRPPADRPGNRSVPPDADAVVTWTRRARRAGAAARPACRPSARGVRDDLPAPPEPAVGDVEAELGHLVAIVPVLRREPDRGRREQADGRGPRRRSRRSRPRSTRPSRRATTTATTVAAATPTAASTNVVAHIVRTRGSSARAGGRRIALIPEPCPFALLRLDM